MRTLPYGTWPSPIDARLTAAHDGRPDFVGFVGTEAWWTEARPTEGGRRALVRQRPPGGGTDEGGGGTDGGATPETTGGAAPETTAPGAPPDGSVLPAPWNVRNRVIEYGGAPWAGVERPGGQGPLLVFTDFADQRLYAYEPDLPGAQPSPLTPHSPLGDGLRWADPTVHLDRGEVWCVLEEFTGPAPTDVRRVLAAVPLDGSAAEDRAAVRELTDDSRRFVTGARLSPDGTLAAWLAWDHPMMPWDGTEVLLAEVGEDGRLGAPRVVAGGPEESVPQVDWDSAGRLLFASDRTGWWNLYRVDPAPGAVAVPLCPRAEEFAGPLWKIGLRWFAPLADGRIAVVHGQGAAVLGLLDPDTGELIDVPGPWTEWVSSLAAHGTRVIGVAASPRSDYEVVEFDAATAPAAGRCATRVIGAAHHDPVDPVYYPEPQIRTFTGPEGRDIHAHVYPPHHPGHTAPDGELPPYVVWVHGGPTSRAPLVLDLEIAYFTSRGFGVAEVNYGGSTGHGRDYRNRLREQWGIVDVEDCAAVARALAAEGTADPRRLAIRGGSAGGWTSAASLTTIDVYACGVISYPILDLASWRSGETHDFESQYLESLIGPFAEVPGRYAERSPVHVADRITAPFLLLQGLDDVICPPVQCERFLALLDGRRLPHAYLTFEGEGHGFRRADTLVRALEAELSLYAQVFDLRIAGITPLELTR